MPLLTKKSCTKCRSGRANPLDPWIDNGTHSTHVRQRAGMSRGPADERRDKASGSRLHQQSIALWSHNWDLLSGSEVDHSRARRPVDDVLHVSDDDPIHRHTECLAGFVEPAIQVAQRRRCTGGESRPVGGIVAVPRIEGNSAHRRAVQTGDIAVDGTDNDERVGEVFSEVVGHADAVLQRPLTCEQNAARSRRTRIDSRLSLLASALGGRCPWGPQTLWTVCPRRTQP